MAISAPITAHNTNTPISANSKPHPVSKGLKAVCNAEVNGLTGNIWVKSTNHLGASFIGINTSDMNNKGRIDAFTTAGAA